MTTLEDSFRNVLRLYRRVAIVGGPRVGKTTIATFARERISDRRVFLHEEFKTFDLSGPDAPLAMIGATQNLASFLIEGVTVARALRKGMKVDAVVYLHKPRVPRIKGQITMAKGVHTVFKQWRESHRDVPVFVME